jgi:hypothetical protein
MAKAPAVVPAPPGGLWRVARGDNPLAVPAMLPRPGISGGNRFDPLTLDYGVLYFGTDLEACFGETLARLRPSLAMLAVVRDEWEQLGFMDTGTVAADWRQRRTAVHVELPEDVIFLDIESPVTHGYLRGELALGLSSLGLADLDVSTVRGPDRRVTKMISEWAYMAGDENRPRFAGVRYESRIQTGWECWALFDDEDLELTVLETLPITPDMPALVATADLFGLQIF